MIATLWDWLGGIEADEWSAVAAWLTALVAVVAGIVAIGQLGEARRLRREQAAPYVVAYMEVSAAADSIIDVVVKNLGQTAATDVRVTFEPPLTRAATTEKGEPAEPVELPDSLPVLVPGQEHRTFWDTAIGRHGRDLPDRHEATIIFHDPTTGERTKPFRFVLDWGPLWSRQSVTVYGMHHAATALRAIQKDVHSWREGPRGLRVYVRDGDAKDERTRAALEEHRRARAQSEANADPHDAS